MSRRIVRLSAVLTCISLVFLLLSYVPVAPASPLTPQRSAAGKPLRIPVTKTPPTVDGSCADQVYSSAGLSESYADLLGKPGTVYLIHNGSALYVCIIAQPGTFGSRFASVYLDPQGDGSSYEYAQKDDYALRVAIAGGANTSFNGNTNPNGYQTNNVIGGFWNGASTIVPQQQESIEYRIELGRFGLGQCGKLFGLGAYHQWVRAVGDDYGWPSNTFFDQPRTWQLVQLDQPPCTPQASGEIAYVYRGNTADATSFYNLLTGRGYTVTLVPLGDVLATDFAAFDLTIIADDSGELDEWGNPALSVDQVNKIKQPNRPILGLGEGGYAFFGKLALYIGWPNGWHGAQKVVNRAPGAPTSYYASPNPISGDPVEIYSEPVNEVGIYLTGGVPSDTIPVGLEEPSTDHAALIFQGCRQLWGFSGNPNAMTATGRDLFINAVEYARTFQCAPQTPPPTQCQITKTANPPAGTPVAPGDLISYTLSYTNCTQQGAKLIDSVPVDTMFVPNSASDGLSPGADGALIWPIGANSSGTKTFKVYVDKTQCRNQRTVINRATLLLAGLPAVTSNTVTHPVNCPPITLPNDEPSYAESELQIHPYPLVTGRPSEISVKISNSSDVPQEVVVEFQTSPNRFGIGLDFSAFNTQTVTLPPRGNVIVRTTFTPVSSGHYCIQVKVQGRNQPPIYTQRNLDVTESLRAGVADALTFRVRNSTATTANIALVIDNTCPGWNVVVSPAVLTGMAPSEVRDAQLIVTPPDPVTLGTGCHIDVQGWAGETFLGGIRKLDVPPVHLPRDVDPPWLEPEISFNPDPPVVGVPGQICVELQNPLPASRAVTLDYAVADFGAGISFTTVASRNVTLPPNSIAKYCADWTPTASNNLHRCVLVTLRQASYQPLHSQRNIDIVRRLPTRLNTIDVPLRIGNPDLVPHQLRFDLTVFGIDPAWQPFLVDPLGDPPPDVLEAGQTLDLRLRFRLVNPGTALRAAAAPAEFRYGDESRVDVAVKLDDQPVGGFTVGVETGRELLPLTIK